MYHQLDLYRDGKDSKAHFTSDKYLGQYRKLLEKATTLSKDPESAERWLRLSRSYGAMAQYVSSSLTDILAD